MPTIALRARVRGAATAQVTDLDGRQVVLLDIDAEIRQGALSSSASYAPRSIVLHGVHKDLVALATNIPPSSLQSNCN